MATTTTIDATRIKPHMPVVCSDGGQFATVDHTDSGNTIKLTKDKSGQHHWIPMSWVTRVDEHVHVPTWACVGNAVVAMCQRRTFEENMSDAKWSKTVRHESQRCGLHPQRSHDQRA